MVTVIFELELGGIISFWRVNGKNCIYCINKVKIIKDIQMLSYLFVYASPLNISADQVGLECL